MSEIEKAVARAICESMGEFPDTETPYHPKVTHLWQHYIPSARAAIEAYEAAKREKAHAVFGDVDKAVTEASTAIPDLMRGLAR